MSSCGFSTHPSAVSDGRFLLGVATVLSLSVLLTWYGLRLQHPEAVSALWAGGPDEQHSFAESVGYGKDENWRKRLQTSRISEFRMIFHDFIVNLVKSSTQRLVTILQISISLMNSPSKKYVVFLEDIQNNSFFFISSDVSVPKMSFLALV